MEVLTLMNFDSLAAFNMQGAPQQQYVDPRLTQKIPPSHPDFAPQHLVDAVDANGHRIELKDVVNHAQFGLVVDGQAKHFKDYRPVSLDPAINLKLAQYGQVGVEVFTDEQIQELLDNINPNTPQSSLTSEEQDLLNGIGDFLSESSSVDFSGDPELQRLLDISASLTPPTSVSASSSPSSDSAAPVAACTQGQSAGDTTIPPAFLQNFITAMTTAMNSGKLKTLFYFFAPSHTSKLYTRGFDIAYPFFPIKCKRGSATAIRKFAGKHKNARVQHQIDSIKPDGENIVEILGKVKFSTPSESFTVNERCIVRYLPNPQEDGKEQVTWVDWVLDFNTKVEDH